MSITDYEPEILFDAILCTFAMEIISDYKAAIDKIFNALKPQGKFAMIGIKLGSRMPYKLLNPIFGWSFRLGRIDLNRDIISHIESKFNKIDYYEECYFGYYYILSASKK